VETCPNSNDPDGEVSVEEREAHALGKIETLEEIPANLESVSGKVGSPGEVARGNRRGIPEFSKIRPWPQLGEAIGQDFVRLAKTCEAVEDVDVHHSCPLSSPVLGVAWSPVSVVFIQH
jgi:hypothetical protein